MDLFEIWHIIAKGILERRPSQFLFSILTYIIKKMLWNQKVEKYTFFSFSTKILKEIVIKFKRSKNLKKLGYPSLHNDLSFVKF